jgi:hypothetical protein
VRKVVREVAVRDAAHVVLAKDVARNLHGQHF